MPARSKKESQEEQSKRFIDTARQLGCDESADEDDIMRRLAAQKRHEADESKPKTKKPAK